MRPSKIKLSQHSDRLALRSLSEFVVANTHPVGLSVNNDQRILAIPAGCL